MAIFHCSVRGVGRSKSGTATVDYISREGKYRDDNEELAAIWADNLPDFASDAREYFAAADQYERSNGRIGTKIVIALPTELSLSDQKKLISEIMKNAIPADLPRVVAVHRGDGKNPHAHIFFSERIATPEARKLTASAFFKRGGAKKSRACHGRAWVRSVRKITAEKTNEALARAGHSNRVDHRTLQEQGITDRLPQQHRGPKAFERPSRDLPMKALAIHWETTEWELSSVSHRLDMTRKEAQIAALTIKNKEAWRSLAEKQQSQQKQPTDNWSQQCQQQSRRAVREAQERNNSNTRSPGGYER